MTLHGSRSFIQLVAVRGAEYQHVDVTNGSFAWNSGVTGRPRTVDVGLLDAADALQGRRQHCRHAEGPSQDISKTRVEGLSVFARTSRVFPTFRLLRRPAFSATPHLTMHRGVRRARLLREIREAQLEIGIP